MEGRREVAAAGGGGGAGWVGSEPPGNESVPEPSRTEKFEKFSDEPFASSAPPASEAAATTATAIAAAARQPSSRNGAEDARKPRVGSARKAPSVRSDASSRADRWLSAPVTKNR
jgi:hypothetical protein